MRQRQPGFTLIELMITVAVVGILAAIAYPSYMDSVRASRRADAINDLSAIALAQEKWRANNATYGTLVNIWGGVTASSGGYYTLAITANNAIAFTVTATAVSTRSQNGDTGCTVFTINESGPVTTGALAACCKRN